MWQQIRANKRNSVILLITMALCLTVLGYLIGIAFFGPKGAIVGLIIALAVWFILTLISFAGGDQILLASSRATAVTSDVHPQLFNVVEEMTIAANLPKMPKIYIINDPAPNAFATGRSPDSASVAVTAGLLTKLDRDQLQGVIAHEISHIIHRDILFVTLAGIMLGSIVLLSHIFLRGMFYSSMGGSRRRYSGGSSRGGQAQLLMLVVAIVAAILAPIMAQILYFALSRKREYLADAGAVRLTRYPEGLAGALEKISKHSKPLAAANKVTAPMYIANPFKGKKLAGLYSTHPPISERVKILRNISHGATFKDYSDSYSRIATAASVIPASALKDQQPIEIRKPSPPAGRDKTKQAHQLGDLMRRVNSFAFLSCVCGLKMKIPPNFKAASVRCPRCGKESDIAPQTQS